MINKIDITMPKLESFGFNKLKCSSFKIISTIAVLAGVILAGAFAFDVKGCFKTRAINPYCKPLGSTGLCWKDRQLASGITQFSYQGEYKGYGRHFELIRVERSAISRVRVQDAHSLWTEAESNDGDRRMMLSEIIKRVPGAVAAINGGFFHFTPPKPFSYKWDGPYIPGTPVGELIVDGKVINANNPDKKLWGALRIDFSARAAIVDTYRESSNTTSRFSLGAAPILMKDGKIIDIEQEIGVHKNLEYPFCATPGEYQMHIFDKRSRSMSCLTDSGNLFFATIEGKKGISKGFSGSDLARFASELGCWDALNFDGGGTVDILTLDGEGNPTSRIHCSDNRGRRRVASAILFRA
jgi:exopolysaccharide biosynthesis protein